MLQPHNSNMKYETLFTYVDTGVLKIPMFQRDFVWDDEHTADLIDSIVKGYPIGTFILWKTHDGIRYMKNIGNANLPDIPKGMAAFYVLDGQQRITSLYAVRKGVAFTKDGAEKDYKSISIDLSANPDGDDQIVVVSPPENGPSIPVHKLLTGSITELSTNYADHLEKVDIYRSRLTGYDFSVIILEDYPIDVACEVFTRINTGGTPLTLFEIMVARTYSEERDFDLSREYLRLITSDQNGKNLSDAGFETVPDTTVLQCVAACTADQVRRQDILRIDRDKFIDAWPTVKAGIFRAVDYLRMHLRIPVSRLLPYYALLVPFTYFFVKLGNSRPSPKQNDLLGQYFWWASLTNRFSSAVESKMAQDLKRIDQILLEKQPSYRGEEVQLSAQDLMWHRFSTADAFCKAILCLFAQMQPRSFRYNNLVILDNSWLKASNSKNYHHFFPRSYLTKKRGYSDSEANVILNITLVEDTFHKRDIGAKAPSAYMKSFQKDNRSLASTMATHLIDDLDRFGVWRDDYETFLSKRAERVLDELNNRLKPNLS